jgi:hypothetical protein
MRTTILILLLGVGALRSGAAHAADWRFSMAYDAQAKGAALTADHLKVVYADEEYNGSSSGSVSISDGGMSSSQTGSLHVESQDNAATITFRGKAFKLIDGGKTLSVGGKSYPLDADVTVTFAEDGTATVAQAAAAKPAK